jgi:hypothetical protein
MATSKKSGSRKQSEETRVASKGKRDTFLRLAPTLPNPDPTLQKFAASRDGICLYDKIIQQFAFVGGYMAQWIDRVLVTDRAIKPAKANNDADQQLADEAAVRATKAWSRVRNRLIVLQKLLTSRFYGFARAEKVWRFDPVVNEWIQDLYDVPQKAWGFDDAGNDYLFTTSNFAGTKVDPEKFIHMQWGSADTKYGSGSLSEIYLALWFIQQIQEFGLSAVEDFSKLIAIVHIPRSYEKKERADAIAAAKDQYRYVVTAPTDDEHMSIELPSAQVTANGTAGRQEYEVIRFYERWIQIRMLGAPQTQDKGGSGNGKLDEIRSDIWNDKTPHGSQSLDQVLTEQWLEPYCSMNIADLRLDLRPRFESDTTEIISGLNGAQAQTYLNICMALAANQITTTAAEEGFASLGIPRPRAAAIATSIIKERGSLVATPINPNGGGQTPPPSGQQQQEQP